MLNVELLVPGRPDRFHGKNSNSSQFKCEAYQEQFETLKDFIIRLSNNPIPVFENHPL
ncbi:hypothetical protein D3C87_00410 [compost metagenome]